MRAGMGDLYGGVFANDDNWQDVVVDAGNAAGDLAWPWPLHRRYRRLLESRVADLRNTSGRPYGYPITAATFLERFAGEGPWAHVDMLGPALLDDDRGDAIGAGASGYGVRMLVELASRLAATLRRGGAPHTFRRRTTHRPVGELVGLRRLAGRDDGVVVRRVAADGIGGGGVAGEAQRLAAAAAPVLLLAPERARAARLLHPAGAAEARERVGLVPDPVERAVAHVGELEARDRRRSLARERLAVGCDDDRGPPPAAHARLRQVLEDVRQHPQDRDPRADALAEAPRPRPPPRSSCARVGTSARWLRTAQP